MLSLAHRTAIFPLISRLGPDTLAARMARLREDERFRSAAPEGSVVPYPRMYAEVQDEAEMWLSWEFVEFWKSNYCKLHRSSTLLDRHHRQLTKTAHNADPVQRGVHSDPNAARAADGAFILT